MLDPRTLAMVLWLSPAYVGVTDDGTEIRCYEWQGNHYQLTITPDAYEKFMNGQMPTLADGGDATFCRSICHSEYGNGG